MVGCVCNFQVMRAVRCLRVQQYMYRDSRQSRVHCPAIVALARACPTAHVVLSVVRHARPLLHCSVHTPLPRVLPLIERSIPDQAPAPSGPPTWRRTYRGGARLGRGNLHIQEECTLVGCPVYPRAIPPSPWCVLLRRLWHAMVVGRVFVYVGAVESDVFTYRTTKGTRKLCRDLRLFVSSCRSILPHPQRSLLGVSRRTESDRQIEDQAPSEHLLALCQSLLFHLPDCAGFAA